jgi:hypothetical protein
MNEGSTKREQIRAKVRALLALTIENGATEGEAMNAAAMAAKLMAEYDLTYVDMEQEVRGERYGARGKPGYVRGSRRRKSFHEVHNCLMRIAEFFDCRVFTTALVNEGQGGELVYFGSEMHTELAHQMTDMIRMVMETEFAHYLHVNRGVIHGRKLRASFMFGMTNRINQRFFEIMEERKRNVPSRNALVVIRKDVVTSLWAQMQQRLKLKPGAAVKGKKVDPNAYAAGLKAGDNVALRQDAQLDSQRVIEG